MSYSATQISPIGLIRISCNEFSITEICVASSTQEHNDEYPLLQQAFQELNEYFEGTRCTFSFPIELNGTEFQKKVWLELQTIPYGKRVTYGEIAKRIGCKNASRAVGGACNRNKILIAVPCHRVVGTKENLVGFALGLEVKRRLLVIEEK